MKNNNKPEISIVKQDIFIIHLKHIFTVKRMFEFFFRHYYKLEISTLNWKLLFT